MVAIHGVVFGQGEMISHAFMSGYIAAMMMNTPPEDYAKSLECYRKLQLDMPPTAEEEAQGWRDSFEHYKRLAIRDARVWEVMEDCYKLGWDFCMEVEAKIRFLKQRARRHGPPNHAKDADTEQGAWFGDGSLNSSPISGTILGDARVPCGTG